MGRLMDPSDWLTSADPRAMLECLFGPRSEGSGPDLPRKLRLYLVACGRKQWRRMPWVGRTLLTLAERMADGWAPTPAEYNGLYHLAERFAGCGGAPDVVRGGEDELRRFGFGDLVPVDPTPAPLRLQEWQAVTRLAFVPLWRRGPFDNWVAANLHDADLVRDIFRHPLQSYVFHPAWRTDTVAGLAERMYEARNFAPMPILADALDDAGCDQPDMLAHCRSGDPHVRGCWVVDLILGNPTDQDLSSRGRPRR